MINLVRAEICYMKTEFLRSKFAYIIIGLFLLLIAANITMDSIFSSERGIFNFARFAFILITIILTFLPVLYIVMQLQLLLREIREKRCRLQCLLPLAINRTSYTRLLVPLILLILFWLTACVLFVAFYRFSFLDFGPREYSVDQKDLLILMGSIPLTYGLRLFSEKIGIIFGLFYIGIMALGSIYFGAGSEREYIVPLFHEFVVHTINPYFFAVATILFCLIIHFSFMTRNSYLK